MKKLVVEALGTGLLAFTALSTGGDPFAVAAILAIAIVAWGGISGAHFNISVTTAMFMRGEINCVDAVKYAIAQIVGVLIAFMIVNGLNGDALLMVGQLGGEFDSKDIITEFIASFVLLMAILACVRQKITPAWGVGLAHIVLVPMGFAINTSIVAAGFLNGGALVAVVVIMVAQIVGAIVATKLDESLNAD